MLVLETLVLIFNLTGQTWIFSMPTDKKTPTLPQVKKRGGQATCSSTLHSSNTPLNSPPGALSVRSYRFFAHWSHEYMHCKLNHCAQVYSLSSILNFSNPTYESFCSLQERVWCRSSECCRCCGCLRCFCACISSVQHDGTVAEKHGTMFSNLVSS